jgi:hypothetical protein
VGTDVINVRNRARKYFLHLAVRHLITREAPDYVFFVTSLDISDDAPPEFIRAAKTLLSAEVRPEVVIRGIPSPTKIAQHSVALSADITPLGSQDVPLGTGRFILMYDPDQMTTWGGAFRIVCFAQAPLDGEIALDPMLSGVTWSWLVDALDTPESPYSNASGTATRVLSQGFGELADQGETAHIELRASWSPTGHDLHGHVSAWVSLLCLLAGLPPTGDAVSMHAHKRERG